MSSVGFSHGQLDIINKFAKSLFSKGIHEGTVEDPSFSRDQKYVIGSAPTSITVHTKPGAHHRTIDGSPTMNQATSPLNGVAPVANHGSVVVAMRYTQEAVLVYGAGGMVPAAGGMVPAAGGVVPGAGGVVPGAGGVGPGAGGHLGMWGVMYKC